MFLFAAALGARHNDVSRANLLKSPRVSVGLPHRQDNLAITQTKPGAQIVRRPRNFDELRQRLWCYLHRSGRELGSVLRRVDR
jgi:hypothetical protein